MQLTTSVFQIDVNVFSSPRVSHVACWTVKKFVSSLEFPLYEGSITAYIFIEVLVLDFKLAEEVVIHSEKTKWFEIYLLAHSYPIKQDNNYTISYKIKLGKRII